MAKEKEKQKAEQTFESAMERLEQLVEAMEEERLPLDKLLVSYEEGIRLAKLCAEKITTAEKRIEIISRNAEGERVTEPFDPDAAVPASSSKPEARRSKVNPTAAAEEVSLF